MNRIVRNRIVIGLITTVALMQGCASMVPADAGITPTAEVACVDLP